MSTVSTNASFALGNSGDPVTDAHFTAHLRRTARQKSLDLCVPIVRAQLGSNSGQRKPHIDLETLEIRASEIFRVRVVRLRDSVQKELNEILVIPLFHAFQQLIVSSANHLWAGIDREFIQLFLKQFPFHSIFPESIRLGDISGPRFFSAIQGYGSAALEGAILFQELADFGDPIFHASLEDTVNLLCRLDIPSKMLSPKVDAIFLAELINILLREKEFVVIQVLQVGFQNPFRHFRRRASADCNDLAPGGGPP